MCDHISISVARHSLYNSIRALRLYTLLSRHKWKKKNERNSGPSNGALFLILSFVRTWIEAKDKIDVQPNYSNPLAFVRAFYYAYSKIFALLPYTQYNWQRSSIDNLYHRRMTLLLTQFVCQAINGVFFCQSGFFFSLEKIDFIFQISFSLFWTFCNVSALQMTTGPNERGMVQSITNKDSHLFWLTQTIFGFGHFLLIKYILDYKSVHVRTFRSGQQKNRSNWFSYHLLLNWWCCFWWWHFLMQIQFEFGEFPT